MTKTSRFLALAAVAVGTVYLVPDAFAGQNLKSPEGRFAAVFPMKAEYMQQMMDGPDGKPLKLHLYGTEAQGIAFMVSYNDYSFTASSSEHADTILNGVVDGVAQSMNAKVEKSGRIAMNQVPGRAATLKMDSGTAYLRAYLKGKRLYQVMVLAPPGAPPGEAQKFFTSFKITG